MDGVIKKEGWTTFVPPPPPFSPSPLGPLVTSPLLLLSLSSCQHPYPSPSPPTFSSLSVIFFCPPRAPHQPPPPPPPPPHTPASSVSPASAINLFSSHLTTVEWFISDRFAAARPSPADRHVRVFIFYHWFAFSEVANCLNSKFNLVPALWLWLIAAKQMQTCHYIAHVQLLAL